MYACEIIIYLSLNSCLTVDLNMSPYLGLCLQTNHIRANDQTLEIV